MKPKNDSCGILRQAWIMGVASLIVIAGFASPKVVIPDSPGASLESSAPEEPVGGESDESWPTDAYVKIGLPDPDRFWTGEDYRDARDVLYALVRTNRAALPRMDSPKSGAVFAR